MVNAMKTNLLAISIVLALANTAIASASAIIPVSYTFDQPTACGSWCYLDTSSTPSKLTDGVLGNSGWAVNQGKEWDGWLNTNINIDFNFGHTVNIDSIQVGSTQDALNDVVLPSIKIYESNNDSSWSLVGSLNVPADSANNKYENDTSPNGFLTLNSLDITDQYVRVDAIANGPWIFIDEVKFNGISQTPLPAAMWMVGSALVGVGFFGKRRKIS